MKLHTVTLAATLTCFGCDLLSPPPATPASPAAPASVAATPGGTAPAVVVPSAAAPAGSPAVVDPGMGVAPVPTAAPVADVVPSAAVGAPSTVEASAPVIAKTYAASLEGLCEHYRDCGCGGAETVEACLDVFAAMEGADLLPTSMFSCLNAVSCAEVCIDSSAPVTRCNEAARAEIVARTEEASRQQAAGHAARMRVHSNMGATCPGGQRLVNGICGYY